MAFIATLPKPLIPKQWLFYALELRTKVYKTKLPAHLGIVKRPGGY